MTNYLKINIQTAVKFQTNKDPFENNHNLFKQPQRKAYLIILIYITLFMSTYTELIMVKHLDSSRN
jgi:hypothetical protein